MLENVLVQLAQPLSGLDAELLHEPCARGVEGRQRVGLPPAAIERQHLQLHEALLEGMRDDQRVQLAQELAVAAQLEVELDPLDDRGQALLLQAPRSAASRLFVLTPPSGSPRQRPSASSIRSRAACGSPPARARCAWPSDCCQRSTSHSPGSHVQQVAARLIDQPAAVSASLAQRLAQARDMHLQAYTRSRGRVLAPQLVDQPLGGHDATAL